MQRDVDNDAAVGDGRDDADPSVLPKAQDEVWRALAGHDAISIKPRHVRAWLVCQVESSMARVIELALESIGQVESIMCAACHDEPALL